MFRFTRILCANYRRLGSFKNQIEFTPKFPKIELPTGKIFITLGIMGLFEEEKKPEEQEKDLIMAIKRGVLSIQREEFQKAEQMLHIALRMAQTVKNTLAETYIFDLLANLAYENGNLEKAEKIFVSVIKRLLEIEKAAEDDIRLLHISTKVAHISYLQNDLDKAMIGFRYVLEKIEARDYSADEAYHELWGMVKNFIGQSLIAKKDFEQAKQAFLEAQKVYIKFKEENSEDGMILLNNLSVCCAELKEYSQSEKYLKRAIEIAKELKIDDISPYQINLGMLYVKQNLIEQAQKACKFAWQLANKYDNKDAKEGAEKCLDQVKKLLIKH